MIKKEDIRIVVVEDDDAHAALIGRALESWSDPVDVTRMSDGQAALDYLMSLASVDEPLPDMILLDLKLPRLSGIKVLTRIKADPVLRHVPVITLTSSKAPADVAAAYEAHANSYLVKPIGFEKFRQALLSVHDYWVERNTPSPAISRN